MACINVSTGSDHNQVRQRKSSSSSTSMVDEESLKPKSETEPPILRWWNKIVVVSCVTAVLTDPLFFYIPLINDQRKCLAMDKNLRIVALLLRSVTDIIFIIDITNQVRERTKIMAFKGSKDPSPSNSYSSSPGNEKKVALEVTRRLKRLSVSIVIHLLAILPFPQVSVLLVFFRMRDNGYMSRRSVLNAFLLFQYVPNMCRLRLSYKKLQVTQRLVKGAFNFLSYIIASHVVGAFWYFFSIQRETSCWYQACRTIEGCMPAQCGDRTSAEVVLLNTSCPIDPSNSTMFDFGMYLDTLQSGYTRQTSFPKKFFYSFWWGLKNLSNFGTNLETSSYVWENCFAILISITGLLLFLYLIGNVQAYMQFSKSKEMDEEELSNKMKEKETEILQYLMPRKGLPLEMRTEIMRNIKHDKLKNKLDSEVDMDLLFYLLPWNIEVSIKHHVGMDALKKVPLLQHMDEKVLQKICEHLKPVSYSPDHVFKTGKEIDAMLFVTEGSVWPIHNGGEESSMVTGNEDKLDYFGEELLKWVSPSISFPDLQSPKRTQKLKCQTKIEAFVLIAKDLKSVARDFRRLWNWNFYKSDIDPDHFEKSAGSLNKINETYIHLWEEKLASVQKEKMNKEISEWVSRTGLSEDVEKKISKHIEENKIVKKNIDAAVDLPFLFSVLTQNITNAIGMDALRKVPMLQKMPEPMLESICRYLEPVTYIENAHIIKAGTELDFMLFVIEGIMIWTNTTSDSLTTGYMMPKLCIEKGDVYGEKLMSWASSNMNVSDLPISTQDFKCQKKIEAFSLKASHVQNVVSKLGSQWSEYYIAPPDYENKTYLQKLKEVQRQLTTTPLEKIEDDDFRQKMKILVKEYDIPDWLSRHALPDDVVTDIMKYIKENKVAETDIDFHMDVKYLLSIDLPWRIEKTIRDHLSMTALMKVPMLQQMPISILESICSNLEPVVYTNNDCIFEKGKSLDLMLIVIEGEIALTETKTSDAGITDSLSVNTETLGEGDIFGKELLNWASPRILLAGSAPVSPQYAQCQKRVEAFTLTISKLRSVVSEHDTDWMSYNCDDTEHLKELEVLQDKIDHLDDQVQKLEPADPGEIEDEELRQQKKIKNRENAIIQWMSKYDLDEDLKKKVKLHIRINNSVGNDMDSNSDVDVKYLLSLFNWGLAKPITEHFCITILRTVPMLKTMHEDVLKKICYNVKPVVYDQNICIIEKGKSLDFMLIIVEGVIEWTDVTTSDAGTTASTVVMKAKGEIFGEQLLHWASPNVLFSGFAPTATGDVKCQSKVEAFSLSTKDLRSVVFEYEGEWNSAKTYGDRQQVEAMQLLHNKIDQTYMQLQFGMAKLEEIDDEEVKKAVKIKNKENNILEWMSKHSVNEELKDKIISHIRINNSVVEKIDADVDVKYLLSLFPWGLGKPLTEFLCVKALQKVPMLENVPEDVFARICYHVEPRVFTDHIVLKGKPLDFMLIIVDGEIEWTGTTSDAGTTGSKRLQKGGILGEELLNLASPNILFSGPPSISAEDVICNTKVEAFALTTVNLRCIVSEYCMKGISPFNSCSNMQLLEELEFYLERVDQTYMQLQSGTTKLEEIQDEQLRKAVKIKMKENDILEWMSKNGLDEELKIKIMLNMRINNSAERIVDGDVHVKSIISLFGWDLGRPLTEHFCISTLLKVRPQTLILIVTMLTSYKKILYKN
ncbi:uncharacterized protein LOC126787936 [Argentina anserina]|uniref:uncharacterized protein LOC126787936 n=1 Tax=Argentina anserina TaxID=57926 RepID=UPI0021766A99|nr:uncharacterized protein LOC126787936 [Potentilla anserina]